MRVALASCAEYPQLDEDGQALAAALRRLSVEAVPMVWDDPGAEWAAFDLVLPCWTWGFFERRETFLAWAEKLPRVANPVDVLGWNSDKAYLADLAAAGVAVVETLFIPPGERFEPPPTRFVVKPTLATGAVDAASYWPDEAAAGREHVERLHVTGRTAMVQPYLTQIDQDGEVDLVFIGTAYSHAVCKGALLTDGCPPGEGFLLQEDIGGAETTPAQRALAERTLAVVPGGIDELLYARVDLAPGPDGHPVVLEVELVEPSLFFGHGRRVAERLADAVVSAAGRPPRSPAGMPRA